ncbi:hypothetical protein S83_030588, partial [Arachis hypogaea]
VFRYAKFIPNPIPSLPIIRTILIRERITIVHGHQAFSTLCHEALMHSRTMGYRVVFTDHSLCGFSDAGNIHMNKVLQFTLADVGQAICVSPTSKENTVLWSGLPPEKIYVIPNAVDIAMFKPAVVQPSRSEIVIVVISRLVYRKGADLLVEVIPDVCRLHPNVRFIVGGDGPKRVWLEEMREKHSLQDRVEMLGVVPHAQNAHQPEKATEFAASAAEPPQLNPSRVETPVPPQRFSVKGPRRRHPTNGKCSLLPFLESRRDRKCDEANQREKCQCRRCGRVLRRRRNAGAARSATGQIKERVGGSRPEREKEPC